MNTRRNRFLWVLYDFANSIISIVFFLYFAQWVVIDKGVSDLSFNLTFTVSAVLLLLTAPLLGLLLDVFFRRITGLRITTVFTFVFYLTCSLLAISNHTFGALAFFTLGLYAYLLSFTFYTPLINDIAGERTRGVVSGFGIAANYLGQFTGLLIVLPFSKGALNFFGSSPRAETLLPAVMMFFICSLPMLFFFKEPKKRTPLETLGSHAKTLFRETKKLLVFPGVALFFLAYFLFNDAVLTASGNFPIFLEQVWGIGDTVKTYILLGILIASSLGGIIGGFLADRFGHMRTLLVILAGWLIILPVVGVMKNFTLFIVFTILMGFWFGASWAVSRSVMSHISPPEKHNLAFAYFGLVERASSFVGPVVWGIVVSSLTIMGSGRYRVATLILTIFILFGLVALLFSKKASVRNM